MYRFHNFPNWLMIVFGMLMVSFSGTARAIELPPDNFVDAWTRSGTAERFAAENLYGRIDGGAELFLEFGFESLTCQQYMHGGAEIGVEVYAMSEPDAALGIYLAKCGAEKPLPEIDVRNTGSAYQIMLVADVYVIFINNFTGDENLLPVMTACACQLIETIQPKSHVSILETLPTDHKIPGREFLFRGPFALQPIHTFGEGDIFLLQRQIFGVGARYQEANGTTYTLLQIDYKTPDAADLAFRNVYTHLDSYLTPLDKTSSQLIFQDYKQKYGIIERSENRLRITIHLLESPIKMQ
ncbi:hypothetical protein JW960_24805 [candidate division KSB1 bacterium]|nr:hypothetical protein [candidate division KSB1 bacterium]